MYKTFIEEFQEEFEKFIKEEPFVPCVDKDGEQTFECIDNIINDMTGHDSERSHFRRRLHNSYGVG